MDGRPAAPELSHLYLQHRARALAIARRILRDADDAEDVVQEVFARLCKGPLQFEGRAACSTWLHRVMVNSSISSLRARARRGRLDEPRETPPDPEQEAIDAQVHQQLLRALAFVSKRHREVVRLRDLRGLSYPEIAQLLGVPQGTVKSSLHRGRAQLQKAMASLDPLRR